MVSESTRTDDAVAAGPGARAIDGPESRSRRELTQRPVLLFVARLGTILAVLGLWQVLSDTGAIDEYFFSKPTAVWDALVRLVRSPNFAQHLQVTLTEASVGLVAGCAAGMVVGFLFAKSPLLYKLFDPILSALYTLPRVALAPLFILWFGLGASAKIALVISIVFFIMLLNTYAAMTSVDSDLVDAMRLLGAGRVLLYRRLYVPFAVPYLIAALRISLSFAIAGAVVGEMLVAEYGLGKLLRQRQDLLDTAGTFAVLTVIAGIAILLNAVIKLIEVACTRWRPASGGIVQQPTS